MLYKGDIDWVICDFDSVDVGRIAPERTPLREFTLLIILASIIAVPIAWYMMNSWLENFAFKIEITAWVFIIAILCSVIIAWITVGYKSIKAAVASPVKSLRTD